MQKCCFGCLAALGARSLLTVFQAPVLALLLVCFGVLGFAHAAPGDAACVECHKEFKGTSATHEASPFGCAKCHKPEDTSGVPHKNLGFFKGGKITKVSKSCLACHDKPAYTKNRHGGMGAGCTGCHSAHAVQHGKLVTPDTSTLCFTCHERKEFQAKFVHDPVASGSCTDCHAVHATEHGSLLAEAHVNVCLDCHKKVKKTPHATAGFSGSGHPVGGEKQGLMDPARPAEPYYCGSCHNPHISNEPRLIRFDQKSPTGFCQQCHKI